MARVEMRIARGDLGRRVTRRRVELNLSRQELAARSGMSSEFVDYVETQPAELSTASLNRLAAALRTTTSSLLGAEVDRPSGRRGSPARPKLRELPLRRCWELLGRGGVGRVAGQTSDGPFVVPVNFAVVDDTIVFRTAAYGALARLGMGFDRIDEATRRGWSVLMVGPLERVDDPDEAAGIRLTSDPQPWAGGTRPLLLRIRPRLVTGRRIETRG